MLSLESATEGAVRKLTEKDSCLLDVCMFATEVEGLKKQHAGTTKQYDEGGLTPVMTV